MGNIHRPDRYKGGIGKLEKGHPGRGVRNEDPLTEGPSKRITRRRMLFLSIAGAVGALGAAVLGGARCEAPYKVNGMSDSGVKDGGVDSGDASNLDAEVKDVDVPDVFDARTDTSVPDSAVDSSVDSGVDSAVDGSTTCPVGTNETKAGWLLPKTQPQIIGTEYEVTYTTYVDSTHMEIDVKCVSTAAQIVSAYQLTLNQESLISLGGKNLRITPTLFNSANAMVDAATETP